MIVYEQNYFDASVGSTCYVVDVADRNSDTPTNDAMKRYNEDFYTFQSRCVCKSGVSIRFYILTLVGYITSTFRAQTPLNCPQRTSNT